MQTTKKPNFIEAVRALQAQGKDLVKKFGNELEAAVPGVTDKLNSNHPDNILAGLELAKTWLDENLPEFQAVIIPEPSSKAGKTKSHNGRPRGTAHRKPKKSPSQDTPQVREHVQKLLWDANQKLGGDFRQQVRDLTPRRMRDIIDLGEDEIIARGKVRQLEQAVAEMARFEEMARKAYLKHHG